MASTFPILCSVILQLVLNLTAWLQPEFGTFYHCFQNSAENIDRFPPISGAVLIPTLASRAHPIYWVEVRHNWENA